jgi:glutaredoxin
VSFPLLADFEPKGAVASSFGHYLAEAGITDRATVIIDKSGVIRYSVSVTPAGQRDIDELVAECEKINAAQSIAGDMPKPGAMPSGTILYVKSSCGYSRRALLALDNLHLSSVVKIENVTDSAAALADLKGHGKDQAPCLVLDGEAVYETDAIVDRLVSRCAPL